MKLHTTYTPEELQTIFVDGGYVSAKHFDSVKESENIVLELIRKRLLTPDLVGQAIAEHAGVSYADINSNGVAPGWHEVVPEADARALRMVVYQYDEEHKLVRIATDTLTKLEAIVAKAGELYPHHDVEVLYGLTEDVSTALQVYETPLGERLEEILKTKSGKISVVLDEIFYEALQRGVSDIHFEPRDETVYIRFRVDGVLAVVGTMTPEYYKSIVNRIKILADLRIDEHLKTQDGSVRFTDQEKRIIDLRVSIAPTVVGEKVVVRVLSQYAERNLLEDLGLTDAQATALRAASEKPLGLVVVAGPTGSGKTTTLHTVLHSIASPKINITTIEDPVEYRLDSANQIQVNQEQGITFAKGLRSIVRQDPDVILVGEIRDVETAEIGINAALTGHRVFTTFHASSAAVTIPRMLDMGVEPFLLSSTLSVVMGQRLVRTLCTECRYSVKMTRAKLEKKVEKSARFFKVTETLYEARGCPVCGGTGYRGRTAIAEVLPMSTSIRELILARADATTLEEAAVKEGMEPMFVAGLSKVRNGITSLDELLRVVTPPDA